MSGSDVGLPAFTSNLPSFNASLRREVLENLRQCCVFEVSRIASLSQPLLLDFMLNSFRVFLIFSSKREWTIAYERFIIGNQTEA